MALNHCRNCGYLTEARYCGNPECMETLAHAAASLRTWSGRAMLCALLLGFATALFVAFFENQGWQDRALRWAFENEQYGLAVNIVEREWGGLTSDQWTTVGIAGASALAAFAFLASLSVALRLRAVPGLHAAVQRELARRWHIEQTVGAFALLPLTTIVVATTAAVASPLTHLPLRRHAPRLE